MRVTKWFVMSLGLLALVTSSAVGQEWRARMEAALKEKHSYDFKEMAFGDMAKAISADAEVNIILDSRAGGVDLTRKMTLGFKDMSYENILTWTTRAAGYQWCVQDEAVYIAPVARLDQAARLQVEERVAQKRAVAEKTWLRSFRKALARKVDAEFRGKRLEDVTQSLESLLDVNVLLSAEVSGKITINLSVSKMTAENLLAWVAREAGIDYMVTDEAVYFDTEEQIRAVRSEGLDFSARGRAYDLISFKFKNEPLDKAIETLEERAGLEIALRHELAEMPRVTLSGEGMKLIDALRAIVGTTGLHSAIVPEGGTIVIVIMNAPELPPDAAPDDDAAEEPAAPVLP